jgi:UPF0755 protein
MKPWVSALLFLIVVGGGGYLLGSWHFGYYMDRPIAKEKALVKVVVPKGADLGMATEILKQEGVLSIPLYFRLYAFHQGVSKEIRPGVYHLDLRLTPRQVLDELLNGPRVPYVRLTIPEGANQWKIAGIVDESGLGKAEELRALMRDEELLKDAGVKADPPPEVLAPLEGWLFPETYFVEPGQSLREVLTVMIRQTIKELRLAKKRNLEAYARTYEETKLTDLQLLTLASIVEAETALPYEMKLIASVFYNRLKKGMPLQTDPTLTYSDERKGAKPTRKDRENKKNPYNTYAIGGLPPGPIGNPGRAAINAVMAPARSRFLYFVAKRDGSGGHHFSVTYEEHLKAVKKYLKDK